MTEMSDQQLIEAVCERLERNRKALHDLRAATRQLEKTNERLQESEALKSQFLSNIRNEINNPLTAILGWARQLENAAMDGEKVTAIGRMIHQEAFRLDFQLENIFIAAELEAGEAVPAPARTEVSRMIGTAFDSLREQAAQKGIALEVAAESPLFFSTDAHMLHIILSNLLVNAVEFSPEGGAVKVAAGCEDDRLEIVVENSGSGIAPEYREKAFDRFRQLETGSTKSHPGHGLGLSIIKALVELQGGVISLGGEKERGCTVTVSLPVPASDSDVMAEDGNFFLFAGSEALWGAPEN